MKKKKILLISLLSAVAVIAVCVAVLLNLKARITLNGVSIEDYTIVYSADDTDYSERAAKYLQSEIEERTGNKLKLCLDSEEPSGEYEIVVGETSRPISQRLDADCEGLQFAILTEEKQIALEGDYFIIAAAAYYFVDTYAPEKGGDFELSLGTKVLDPIVKEAENFILLIGDGMGEYQTRMFEYFTNTADYSDGEDIFYGSLLPYRGTARTQSLTGVTDSAAAGTALSCGYKTENKIIGQLPDGTVLTSITELALSRGMGAGVMSTEVWKGATPSTFSSHTSNRDNSTEIREDQAYFEDTLGGIVECDFNNYDIEGIAEMESKIRATLDALDDKDGFFMMFEEAYIDKYCAQCDLWKTFDALVRFNQAIAVFMEYAFYNPETMVIITADHETGGLTPTDDGLIDYTTSEHTSADVPVFAYGKGAECFDGVNMENIQIPKTIAKFMGVSDFGDDSEQGPLN
ncbi:MAG: alkaline phosphatase [Clostridia bacterium]|nr:alkaline phosphatase [Clostridia bacterium]